MPINSNKTWLKRKTNKEILWGNMLLHETLYNCPIVLTSNYGLATTNPYKKLERLCCVCLEYFQATEIYAHNS